MADFNAVAEAIATRFSAVTPPSGEQGIRVSTPLLPRAITLEPTVLVFPPTCEFHFGASTRTGICEYQVRMYIESVRDNVRDSTLCNKWLGALYQQMDGQVHLGLADYVTHAVMRSFSIGELAYGGPTYMGIEMTVEVHVWEGMAPVA